MFYWNYESPSCSRGGSEPQILSTSGATILANNEYSDFALLSLNEDPKNLSGYDPYYLGWDRITSLSSTGVVGIHHPSGDVKKIATSFNLPANTTPYWRVNWSQTTNGFSVNRRRFFRITSIDKKYTSSHRPIIWWFRYQLQ